MTGAALFAMVALLANPTPKPRVCEQIKAFTDAPFDASVQPAGRRWVELHWRGHWGIGTFGFGCRHSPDAASAWLCQWLLHNTSFEFGVDGVKRMLTCYGYRFPPFSDWSGWKSDIDILDRDRWIKLEVNFADMAGEAGAIRLSSFDKDKDDALVELPPMVPFPPLAAEDE